VQKNLAREELANAIREVQDGAYAGLRMNINGVHAPAFGGQGGGRATELANKGFTIIKCKGEKMLKDVPYIDNIPL
jgi:hypothetical protein